MANVGESQKFPEPGEWQREIEDRASMYERVGAYPEDSAELELLVDTIEQIAVFDDIADLNARVGYTGSVSVEASEVLYDADDESGIRRFIMRVPRLHRPESGENLYVVGKQYYEGEAVIFSKLIVIWHGDQGLRVNQTYMYPTHEPDDAMPLLTGSERRAPFTWQDFADMCDELDALDAQLKGAEHTFGS